VLVQSMVRVLRLRDVIEACNRGIRNKIRGKPRQNAKRREDERDQREQRDPAEPADAPPPARGRPAGETKRQHHRIRLIAL